MSRKANTTSVVPEAAAKRSVPQFLQKTYEMVNARTTNGVVTWTSKGRSFVILKRADFEKTLLPRYFKHSNFTSFVRQLNMYGFSKSGEKDWWEFSHPSFLRGQPSQLNRIHRKLSAAQGADGATKHDVLKLREDKEKIMDELYEVKASHGELAAHVKQVMKINHSLTTDLESANQKVAELTSTLGNVVKFLAHVHARPSESPLQLDFNTSEDTDLSVNQAMKRRRLGDGSGIGVCNDGGSPEDMGMGDSKLSMSSGLGAFFGLESPMAAVPDLKLESMDYTGLERRLVREVFEQSDAQEAATTGAPNHGGISCSDDGVVGADLDFVDGLPFDLNPAPLAQLRLEGSGCGDQDTSAIVAISASPAVSSTTLSGSPMIVADSSAELFDLADGIESETDIIDVVKEMMAGAQSLGEGREVADRDDSRSPVDTHALPAELIARFSQEEIDTVAQGGDVFVDASRVPDVMMSLEPSLEQMARALDNNDTLVKSEVVAAVDEADLEPSPVAEPKVVMTPEVMQALHALVSLCHSSTQAVGTLSAGLASAALLASKMRAAGGPEKYYIDPPTAPRPSAVAAIEDVQTTATTPTTSTTTTSTAGTGNGSPPSSPVVTYRDGVQFNYLTRPNLPHIPGLIMAQQTLLAMGLSTMAARALLVNQPVSPSLFALPSTSGM